VVAKEARVKEELTIKKDAFYAMIMLTVSRVHPRGVFLYRIAASKRPMFRFHDLQEVRRMLKELGVAHVDQRIRQARRVGVVEITKPPPSSATNECDSDRGDRSTQLASNIADRRARRE